VSTAYFDALDIGMRRGRAFDRSDRRESRAVAIVAQPLAERLWPGQNAVGQRLRLERDTVWREVVGVADPIRGGRIAEPDLQIYVPAQQSVPFNVHYAVRFASGDPLTRVRDVEQAVWSFDALQPIWDIATLGSRRADVMWRERTSSLLFAVFAFIAVVLAAGGIYGLTSFTVGQQTREIGIRMALGARAGRVLATILAESARTIAIGIVAGLMGAAALVAGMGAALPTLEPWNLTGTIGATIALAIVAFIAALVPAGRAARLTPVAALRSNA
jgi:hypothetical protein